MAEEKVAGSGAMKFQGQGIVLTNQAMLDLIDALHRKGASFRFQAQGFSMHPTIRDGDIVTVSPLGGSCPGPGEVVAFRLPEQTKLVIHRVIKVIAKRYLLRGDNGAFADGWIPGENIVGIVSSVERQGENVFLPNLRANRYRQRMWTFLYLHWLPWRRRLAKGRRWVGKTLRNQK